MVALSAVEGLRCFQGFIARDAEDKFFVGTDKSSDFVSLRLVSSGLFDDYLTITSLGQGVRFQLPATLNLDPHGTHGGTLWDQRSDKKRTDPRLDFCPPFNFWKYLFQIICGVEII